MSSTSAICALSHLLPEARVGKVSAVESIALGASGAVVYAVSSNRGDLVLRIHSASDEPARWQQQLRILRLAAESGVAPAIVHVDDAARAVVSERVAGPIGAALGDPTQRDAALSSVIGQLRALHRLDATWIEERDGHARPRGDAIGRERCLAFFAQYLSCRLEDDLDGLLCSCLLRASSRRRLVVARH